MIAQMALPVVVIVGRPNVGKSSLLNFLARERISIVDPRAGITRDRVSAVVAQGDTYIEVVDTGGVGIVDADHLEEHVEEQIGYALSRADLILFVTDVRDGVTALDVRVAELLRKLNRPVILIVNKVDTSRLAPQAGEFHRLGFGEPLCTSAEHQSGRDALLEAILARLGPLETNQPLPPVMKLAIVGKRNSGKSTLVNTLAGEQRVIVSETPGTTRDAVDVHFQKDGRAFIAIDTAGVRKKSSMNDVDFYSHARALRSIRRADVVLLLIEAVVPVSEVDLRLARAVLDEYKPVVLAINKWDQVPPETTTGAFDTYLAGVLPHMSFAPIVIMTGKTGRNVDAAVDLALSLHKQSQTRVPTARLNETLRAILDERPPTPQRGGKSIKIFYATQISASPPTIVCFCNDSERITENYRRFLEARLRANLPYAEVPIRLMFRARSGRERADGAAK